MSRFLLSCLAVVICLSGTAEVAAQGGADRVDTKVALAQVVTSVDPVVPPDAVVTGREAALRGRSHAYHEGFADTMNTREVSLLVCVVTGRHAAH